MRSRAAVKTPVQWTGVVVAVLVGAWAGVLVVVFSLALAEVNSWLAPLTNLVAVGGLVPAVWNWRGRPVFRFLVAGLGAGVVVGWMALLAGLLAS